jgi:hypothetical protein
LERLNAITAAGIEDTLRRRGQVFVEVAHRQPVLELGSRRLLFGLPARDIAREGVVGRCHAYVLLACISYG